MSVEVGGLAAVWTARARQLREWAAAEDAAKAREAAAAVLFATVERERQELLNLQEASRRSGYSADHLGRLVRDGRIPNAGRPHAPRIRVGDLPRKPGAPDVAPGSERTAPSKTTVVRSFMNLHTGGNRGRAA
jgi:hypothetical protein